MTGPDDSYLILRDDSDLVDTLAVDRAVSCLPMFSVTSIRKVLVTARDERHAILYL